jgi:hypothetical protein
VLFTARKPHPFMQPLDGFPRLRFGVATDKFGPTNRGVHECLANDGGVARD